MRIKFRILVIAACLVFVAGACPAQQVMDNAAVLKLKGAGLSEELIITTINNSPGHYSMETDDLIALKKAGLSDRVMTAMIYKNSNPGGPAAPPPPAASAVGPGVPATGPAPRDPNAKPRVFLTSQSKGTNQNAARDQSMEMGKDFERDCAGVRITLNQSMADYTVSLNHIEVGLLVRDNQVQIADHNGDLISKTKEGGSIAGAVKKACDLILADWGKQATP
jgi:hypothetical protein